MRWLRNYLNREWREITCPKCGTRFCVLLTYLRAMEKGASEFWCPNGHGLTPREGP